MTSTGETTNVLLLVIDALRVDRVGAYSGGTLTPNLDALADDSEVFESCFACVNATDSAMTTVMTGQYPTRHGVLHHGKNITDLERERVSGTTPLSALIDNTHRSFGIDMLGRWHTRGFDEYYMDRWEGTIQRPDEEVGTLTRGARAVADRFPSERAYAASRDLLHLLPERLQSPFRSVYDRYLSAGNPYSTYNKVVTQSKGYLEADWVGDEIERAITETDEPWFVLGHFWDTHLPYDAPDRYHEAVADRSYPDDDVGIDDLVAPIEGSSWAGTLRRLADEMGCETSGDIKRRYDAAVRYVDSVVGEIVDELKSRNEYENTAVVITADHGESLTEHDILFDHHGLYDPAVHVPLVVKAPGFRSREDAFVQHTDLAPTILDLLGTSYDPDRFDGYSLADRTERDRRDAVFFEEANTARKRAIRTDEYKYVVRLDDRDECRYCEVRHAADEELYDLASDPGETENVSETEPAAVDRLQRDLTAFIDGLPDPLPGTVDFEQDSDVLARLEYMGYK